MAASETAGETAMLKRMIQVETGIVASSVVPDPGAVVMDVWSFGMALVVVKIGGRVGCCSMRSGRTMLRNESAANGVAAGCMATVLRQSGQREHQGYGNRG